MGDTYTGWSCIECVIKKQEYDSNLAALEKKFQLYKEKLVLTDELIKKYRTQTEEKEALQQKLKKCQDSGNQYRTRLIDALSKLSPTEKELDAVKKKLSETKKQLEEFADQKEATLKHNVQIKNYSQQLNEEIESLKEAVEKEKKTISSLNHELKRAKSAVLASKKKRTKAILSILPIAEVFQKNGTLNGAQKRQLKHWGKEFLRQESGETANISEDEGIFSPEVANSCSSRETGSMVELLSDDDQTSIVSLSMDAELNNRDHTASDMCEIISKSQTSELLKKTEPKKDRKPSLGSLDTLNLDLNSEVTIRSKKTQQKQSSEIHLEKKKRVDRRKCTQARTMIEESDLIITDSIISTKENKSHSPDMFSPKSCDSALDLSEDRTEPVTRSLPSVESLFDLDTSVKCSHDEIKFQAFNSKNYCKKFVKVEQKILPCLDEPIEYTCKEIKEEEKTFLMPRKIEEEEEKKVLACSDMSMKYSDTRPQSLRDWNLGTEIEEFLYSLKQHPPLLSPMSTFEEPDLFTPTKKEKVEWKDVSTMTEMLDIAVGMDVDLDQFNLCGSKRVMQDPSKSCSQQFYLGHNNNCNCKSVESVSKKDYGTQTSNIHMVETGTSTERYDLISCHVQTEKNSENTFKSFQESDNQFEVVYQNIERSMKPWEISLRNRTSEQKPTKKTIDKLTMIRYDYIKSIKSEESNLKDQLTKLENLVDWLCSNDDSNIPQIHSCSKEPSEENSATPHVIEHVPSEKESPTLFSVKTDHTYCINEIKNSEVEVESEHLPTTRISGKQSYSVQKELKWKKYVPEELKHDRNTFYCRQQKNVSKVSSDSCVDSDKIPSSFDNDRHGNDCSSSKNEDYCRHTNEVPPNLSNVPVQLYHEQYMQMNNMLFQLAVQSMARGCNHSCCCQNVDAGRYITNNQSLSHSNIAGMNMPHCQNSFSSNCKSGKDVCEHKEKVQAPPKWKRIIDLDDSSNDSNVFRNKNFTKESESGKNHIIYSSDSDEDRVDRDEDRYHTRPRRKIFNKKRYLFRKLRRKYNSRKLKISNFMKSENVENRISDLEESDDLSCEDEDQMSEEETSKNDESLKKPSNENSLPKHTRNIKPHLFDKRDDTKSSNSGSSHTLLGKETKLSNSIKQNKNITENSSKQINLPERRVTSHPSYKELFGSEIDFSSDEEYRKLKRRKLSENISNEESSSNLHLRRKKADESHETKEKAEVEDLNKMHGNLSFAAKMYQQHSPVSFESSDKISAVTHLKQRQNSHSGLSSVTFVPASKLSKLQKYRRVLIKAKLPSKIAPIETEKLQKSKGKKQSEGTGGIETSSVVNKELLEIKGKIEINPALKNVLPEVADRNILDSDLRKTLPVETNVKKSLSLDASRRVVQKNILSPQNQKIPVHPSEKLSQYLVTGVKKQTNRYVGQTSLQPTNIENFPSSNKNVVDKRAVQNVTKISDVISLTQNKSRMDLQNNLQSNITPASQETRHYYNPIESQVQFMPHSPYAQPSPIQDFSKHHTFSQPPSNQNINRDNRHLSESSIEQVNSTSTAIISGKDSSFIEVNEKKKDKSVEDPSVTHELSQYLDSPVKQSVEVSGVYCDLPQYLNSPVKTTEETIKVPSMYPELSQYLKSPVKEVTEETIPSMYHELPQYLNSTVKEATEEIIKVPSMYHELPQYLNSPVKEATEETIKVPSMYHELPQYVNSTVKEVTEETIKVQSMYHELPQYFNSPVGQPTEDTIVVSDIYHELPQCNEKIEEDVKLAVNANSSNYELVPPPVSPIKQTENKLVTEESDVVSPLSIVDKENIVLKEEVLSHQPVSDEYVLLPMLVERDKTEESGSNNIPVFEEDTKDNVRITRSLAHASTRQNNTNAGKTKFHAGYALRKAIDTPIHKCKTPKKKSKFIEMKQLKEQKKVIGEVLERFISEDDSIEMFMTVVKELGELTTESSVTVLSKYMVKYIRNDKHEVEETSMVIGVPFLTQVQKRLLMLLYNLHSQYEHFKKLPQTVLLGIEYCLFRLGYAPSVSILSSLARFYAALCRLLHDKKRLQTFCYDALYCLAFKAYPLLYTAITTYPDTIPHAKTGKDNLLVTCITSVLLSHRRDRMWKEFRIDDLRVLLSTKYGYYTDCTIDKLLNILVDKLKNSDERVEHLEASFILLAKRMGYEAIYKKLITKIFYPLLNEWKKGIVKDGVVEQLILILGYITRCFPTIEAKVQIQDVLNHLRGILVEEIDVSIKIQEAAVLSLLRLSRSSFIFVASVLLNWRPSSEVSDEITKEIKSFLTIRNNKWWRNFLDNGLCNKSSI